MSTAPSSKCSVLVVEDDVSAGRTLAQLLREDGYEVEVVLDGEAAMARLTRAPTPDVLITDYRLPRADGLEVATYGRKLHPNLSIVMVTSYPEVIARIGSRADVPTVILSKPLVYAELTRELDRLIERVGA
ncbi:MAG: response regulator [Myxococcaceae bacterium]|nr:MAG: response regulator [Myxococcaceae bacterium]